MLDGRPLPRRLDRQALGGQTGRRGGADHDRHRRITSCSPTPTSSIEPDVLNDLVARAANEKLVLTSLMVKLRCESLAERSLIPAFIFFFQMLYPFSWVNRTDRATAAAAGGCMLVRADVLRQAGGIDAIRDALDRRLRAGEDPQGARPDLARADRARPQHPPLSRRRRHPPHGRALGLCAIALFAAAARRHGRWAWR